MCSSSICCAFNDAAACSLLSNCNHVCLTTQDEAPLLTPNVLICSVGTEIFYRTADGTLLPDQAWEKYLDNGWDRARVQALVTEVAPQLTPQVRLCVLSTCVFWSTVVSSSSCYPIKP
jgi:hypothetical protein